MEIISVKRISPAVCDLYEVLPDSVYDEIKKLEEQGWSKDEFEATLDNSNLY